MKTKDKKELQAKTVEELKIIAKDLGSELFTMNETDCSSEIGTT